MKMKYVLLTKVLICLVFLIFVTSCANIKTEQDIPYPHDANEAAKQKWIDEKIDYLEKKHGQKVIEVKEDGDCITFVFEIEYMSSKLQVKEERYWK